jgi:TolB protein
MGVLRAWAWRRRLLVALGGLLLAGCGSSSNDSAFSSGLRVDQLYVRDVAVQVTTTEAQISWLSRDPRDTLLQWGTDENTTQQATGDKGVTSHRVTLTGLSADTLYYFRVPGRNLALRFRTLGGARRRIAFASDRGTGRSEICLCLEWGENLAVATANGGHSPALSADGRRLAWVAAGTGGYDDLFVADLDASGIVPGTTRNVTLTANRDEHRPAWSPDGTRLAFSTSSATQPAALVVREVATGSEQVLAATGINDEPAWSADGARLAFTSTRRSATVQLAVRPVDPGSVSVRVDDEFLSPVAPALFDLYDPADGQLDLSGAGCGGFKVLISYTSGTTGVTDEPHTAPIPRQDVYSLAADGTDVRRLTSSGYRAGGAAWAPNGQRLVFVEETSNGSHLVTMDPAGTNLVALTTADAVDRAPTWLPDSSAVLCASNRDQDKLTNLFLVAADLKPVQITLLSGGVAQPCVAVVP